MKRQLENEREGVREREREGEGEGDRWPSGHSDGAEIEGSAVQGSLKASLLGESVLLRQLKGDGERRMQAGRAMETGGDQQRSKVIKMGKQSSQSGHWECQISEVDGADFMYWSE